MKAELVAVQPFVVLSLGFSQKYVTDVAMFNLQVIVTAQVIRHRIFIAGRKW